MNDRTKENMYKVLTNSGDIVIIDVMNHLYRYLFVHQDLSVTIGNEIIPTGHIFGFLRLITFLKQNIRNCNIVLAFDGWDEERHDVNSEYKGNRSHKTNIKVDLGSITNLCGLYSNVYTIYDENYEADDAIYTLSNKIKELCKKNNIEKKVYILTNDKDLFQCVGENNEIIRKFGSGSDWYNNAEKIVTEEDVRNKFEGVNPTNLAKYRAITGDESDNLKGYPRFFKKKASYIAEHSYIENGMIRRSEDFEKEYDKYFDIIKSNPDIFIRNYKIMKLKDFDFELIDVACSVFNAAQDIEKFELKTFKSAISRISPYREELKEELNKMGVSWF